MSSERPTGKQIDYLLALGVKLSGNASREDASTRIEKAKETLKNPPNSMQCQLARQWGLDVDQEKNGYGACDVLMRHINARRFVYSMCRRQAGASWRLHSDSNLDDARVNELAHWFASNSYFLDAIAERDVGDTTTGDAWYRLTDTWCAKSEAYLATAQKVFESFGTALAQPKPASRKRQAPAASKQPEGCATLLVEILILILLIASQ